LHFKASVELGIGSPPLSQGEKLNGKSEGLSVASSPSQSYVNNMYCRTSVTQLELYGQTTIPYQSHPVGPGACIEGAPNSFSNERRIESSSASFHTAAEGCEEVWEMEGFPLPRLRDADGPYAGAIEAKAEAASKWLAC